MMKKTESPPLASYNIKEEKEVLEKKKINYKLIIIGVSSVLLLILVTFLIWQNLPKTGGKQNPGIPNSQNSSEIRFPTIGLIPPVEPVTLIFTGDVIPARSVNSQMVRKNNFQYPFEKTAAFLKEADLTIINLEAPLIKNCPVTDTGMVFCGDERFTQGLTFAGIDIVTLANNHSANYGKEGVENTVSLLKENNIESTGVGNIVYKEIKGTRFAFIGFNGVSPLLEYLFTIDKENIKKLIQEAKTKADFVTVLFHWSQEYSPIPKADNVAPFDPIEIAHFAINNGADLIVGNHPHTVLGYENYQSKLIFYALGNFIFDQMWSYETRVGAVLKINLLGSKVTNFSLYPVLIENYAQPVFLEGAEKDKVLEKMQPINPN